MNLVIYDFDGTVYQSNTKPPADFAPGNPARVEIWMSSKESLGTPISKTVQEIRSVANKPKTTSILVTRRTSKARSLVSKALSDVGLRPSVAVYQTRKKAEWLYEYLNTNVGITSVEMWEDDEKILRDCGNLVEKFCKEQSAEVKFKAHLVATPKSVEKVALKKSTINPLRSAAKVFDTVQNLGHSDIIVGFSGGKDSLTVLDLCVKRFGVEHVKVFFLYTLPDLECESKLADLPTKRYGLPVLKYPLPEIMAMIKNGYARHTPPSLNALLDRKYGWNEIEMLVRYKTGFRWLAYGHRQQDSLHRRGMLNRCQGAWDTAYTSDKPIQRSFPIWQWSHKDVFAYLKSHHLPIPHMFGNSVINTSGLSLMDADTLLHVKQHFPDDYKRLKRVFPGLETPIFRQEVLQRSFAQMDETDAESKETSPITLQQTSELFETELAKILKLEKTKNNFPVDWIAYLGDQKELGIELKVLNKAEDGQSRVQMRPSAKNRKDDWLREGKSHGVRRGGITVLIDNRDNYAGGKYADLYSGHRIYYKAGFGAYRISAMMRLPDLESLVFKIYGLPLPIRDANQQFESLLQRTYG